MNGCKNTRRHAATVMHGAGLHFEFVIIGNDDPAFASGDQLARLKTEGPRHAKGPNPLAAPFTGVRVRRILHQRQSFALGDLLQPIEIRGVPTHVHRDDRLRPRSDRRFYQVGMMQYVSGSTSTSTGSALANKTALAVATNVKSAESPRHGSDAEPAMVTSRAAVPLVTAMPWRAP